MKFVKATALIEEGTVLFLASTMCLNRAMLLLGWSVLIIDDFKGSQKFASEVAYFIS